MPYTAIFLPKAEKYLVKLDKDTYEQIEEHVEELKKNPFKRRPLADIKKLVRIKTIFYASNHGLEIAGNHTSWRHKDIDGYLPYLAQVRRRMKRKLNDIAGLSIENKRVTFSVHYREVGPDDISKVKSVVTETLEPFNRVIKITRGKKVIDARPFIHWNKGLAVRRMLRMYHADRTSTVLYAGDDTTDEDAFALLGPRAITIRVGFKRSSHAAYYVKRPSELLRALKMILELRDSKKDER